MYYDIVGHEAYAEAAETVAVARIEQLYPFPTEAVAALVASYPWLEEVVWAQEEPQNMGPWRSIRHRLEEAAAGRRLRFVGRPWRASPSEGYPTAHLIEQDRIAREALTRAHERRRASLLEAYRDAVHAKDVEAFVAIFADDVRVFDMWGTWSHDGIDSWREMAVGWFGSLGDELVRVEFDDVQTTVGDDTAVLSAFVTFAGLSADGEELRSMNNRLTWGLRKTDGTWKVVHEHTSAPVEMATGKVDAQALTATGAARRAAQRPPASRGAGRASVLVTRPTCAAASAAAATDPTA